MKNIIATIVSIVIFSIVFHIFEMILDVDYPTLRAVISGAVGVIIYNYVSRSKVINNKK